MPKKRELETRHRLVAVERDIISPAPLFLVAPHRMHIKDGPLRFSYNAETVSGNVYILNDCIVLTKTEAKPKDKGVVNLFLKNINEQILNTPSNLEQQHYYLETIPLRDLEIVDVSNVRFILQLPAPNSNPGTVSKWDFFFETEDSKREWHTAFKEAIDAYALNALFDDDLNNSEKNFVLLSATYGRLKPLEKTSDKKATPEQMEVTDTLHKIMRQQGGNQLILNAGPKSKLFGFTSSKKTKKQLKIVYSIRGKDGEMQLMEKVFQDGDPVKLPEDS